MRGYEQPAKQRHRQHHAKQRYEANLEQQRHAQRVLRPRAAQRGRVARVMVGDVFTGWVGELHPRVNEALGFPAHSAAFELNLTALFATLTGKPVQAKPISTFPPVKQDLAFTVDETVTAGQLENVIRKAAGANLESIELFDVFTGEQVGEGKKSLAYAVVFRSPSKTLSAEDSDAIRKAIVAEAAEIGAQLRA